MSTTELLESISATADNIDRSAGVIRNCKVIQPVSRNGYSYLQEAIEGAVSLYEGQRIYIDHIPKGAKSAQRRKSDRWGRLVNVRPDGNGGLDGDIEFLKTHPMTEPILESVERFGDTGLSHHADGKMGRDPSGKPVVTEIHKVRSVDFVEEAATNKSLFEGFDPEGKTMKTSILAVLQEGVSSPSMARLLSRATDQEIAFNGEIELAEGADAKDAIPEALGGFVSSLFADKGIEEACKLMESLFAADQKASASGDDEIKQLREELDAMKAEKAAAEARSSCKQLLEAADVEVTDVRLDALVSFKPDARQALVDSWKGSRKPSRSPGRSFQEGLEEEAGDLGEKPDLAAALGYRK